MDGSVRNGDDLRCLIFWLKLPWGCSVRQSLGGGGGDGVEKRLFRKLERKVQCTGAAEMWLVGNTYIYRIYRLCEIRQKIMLMTRILIIVISLSLAIILCSFMERIFKIVFQI